MEKLGFDIFKSDVEIYRFIKKKWITNKRRETRIPRL